MNDTQQIALRVASLGWGIQSFTLVAMAALGELEPLDAAIHADTTWERQSTYQFARALTPWLEERDIRVITLSDGEQAAKVTSEATDPPFFTTAGPNGEIVLPAYTVGDYNATRAITDPDDPNIFAPVYTLEQAQPAFRFGDQIEQIEGQLRRQCTERWKIAPQRRWLLAQLLAMGLAKKTRTRVHTKDGLTPIDRVIVAKGVKVEKWLGISQDEWHRAKKSDVSWEIHRYPLLEKGMTRADCINWLREHDLPVPHKSSCVFCPYHNKHAWQELKRGGGQDWQTAVEVDAAIRDKRPPFPLFVHRARVPLDEAISIAEDHGMRQGSLFDDERAEDEEATCDSGYCFL